MIINVRTLLYLLKDIVTLVAAVLVCALDNKLDPLAFKTFKENRWSVAALTATACFVYQPCVDKYHGKDGKVDSD